MNKLHLLILLPLLVATLLYFFSGKRIKQIAILFQLLLVIGTVFIFLHVKVNGTITENLGGYVDYVGITLRADLLSSVMIMLTTFLFLAMLIYNYPKDYMNNLFLFLFIVLQALLIGIFLANDLFSIYVMMEVSTLVVSILIMFKKDSRSIYDGMVYLLINIVAMSFFLFGIGFLYKTFGMLDFTGIKEKMLLIQDPKSLILPYSLMITSISLKAALMPLFSWLPKAHGTPSAPSIVSAILSGLYVKSGLYLFIRFQDLYGGVFDTSEFFMIMGFLTGIIGFIFALSQSDIKLILAYHTISQIGLIMMGLSLNSDYSYWGAIYHIINHAFFKTTLFLTAGIIIEEYGTRNIWDIKGVFKRMPLLSIASILAILGITGAPLFNGSISKYLIQSGYKGHILEYGLLIINLGTIISFIKYSSMFWGKSKEEKAKLPIERTLVITTLGIVCFIGGIYGQKIIQFLFDQKVVIHWSSYLQKVLMYILNLVIGYVIYKKVITKTKILYKVQELTVGFNTICLFITGFFCLTLVYLFVTI